MRYSFHEGVLYVLYTHTHCDLLIMIQSCNQNHDSRKSKKKKKIYYFTFQHDLLVMVLLPKIESAGES